MPGSARRAELLRWYTMPLWALPPAAPAMVIGVVARVNPDIPDWAAYIGPALGEDEQVDALAIAGWGAKLEEDVARVYAAGKEYAAWPYRR